MWILKNYFSCRQNWHFAFPEEKVNQCISRAVKGELCGECEAHSVHQGHCSAMESTGTRGHTPLGNPVPTGWCHGVCQVDLCSCRELFV